mgnify:CR=1 FL=1
MCKDIILILKEKAVCYQNENELTEILETFQVGKYDMKNNGYMFYSPENVMDIFNNVAPGDFPNNTTWIIFYRF